MVDGMVTVNLDGATQAFDRLLVRSKLQLGETGERHPAMGAPVPRTEAKRFLDMNLGFLAATHNILGESDGSVSPCQISIQRQRSFAFGNALWYALGIDLDEPQRKMCAGMIGSQGQGLAHHRFGCCVVGGPIVGRKDVSTPYVNHRRADERLDIAGIERQGAFEKSACLRRISGVNPLFRQALPWK